MPDRLYFTDSDEANELMDRQVTERDDARAQLEGLRRENDELRGQIEGPRRENEEKSVVRASDTSGPLGE